jgi:hypothetical protein
MISDSNLIIVTGYGQFRGHEVNASGEAVKLLPEKIDVQGKIYEIRKIFVEVEYEDVDRKIDEIWNLNPFLVVHCGELKDLNSSLNFNLTKFFLFVLCFRSSWRSEQN